MAKRCRQRWLCGYLSLPTPSLAQRATNVTSSQAGGRWLGGGREATHRQSRNASCRLAGRILVTKVAAAYVLAASIGPGLRGGSFSGIDIDTLEPIAGTFSC